MVKTRQFFQIDKPTVANKTTVADTYAVVPFTIEGSASTRQYWDTWHLTGIKILRFSATTQPLLVKILGSIDGSTFPETVVAEFTVATATPVVKRISDYWSALQVQVNTASAGANGTLAVSAVGTTMPEMGDIELSADVSGLATSAKQDFSYKGADRKTMAGAAQEVTIPANVRIAHIFAEAGDIRAAINGDASATSSVYVVGGGMVIAQLVSATKLSVYVATGTYANIVFYG
jgi:hypothetical protein